MSYLNKVCLFAIVTLNINVLLAASNTSSQPYNIILIISDQSRYKLVDSSHFPLPAADALAKRGVTFKNHYIASAMCSPSRAAFLTGTTPQVNHVFDQVGYFFVESLDPNIPNMGNVLKKLGYQTAYFGKFEMDKTVLLNKSAVITTHAIEKYGFDVFSNNGDSSGKPLQGYTGDPDKVGQAISWLHYYLREKKNTKPFFLVVSVINSHDIMYGDANLSSAQIQKSLNQKTWGIYPPPPNKIYQQK